MSTWTTPPVGGTRASWSTLALGSAALAIAVPSRAHATYSIAGADMAAREVGGAGASCIGSASVRVIYGSVPGKGVVHAQALLGGPGKSSAVMQLAMDVAPATIISAITAQSFDGNAQRRQYGIVDLIARSAGFTGTQTGAFADDRQARVGSITYSVQGNILTSAAVLDQAASAFSSQGCDLADRLMLALEAGALGGEGDSRCTPRGIPADSAFLQVDRTGEPAGSYLMLDVTGSSPQSPLVMLRAQYDAWRATHPCPAPVAPDAGAGGAGDAGLDETTDAGCCGAATDPRGWFFAVVFVFVVLARRPGGARR